MADPKPPSGLAKAGRHLWRTMLAGVADGWELDARDLALLESAACAADRVAALESLVDREGMMSAGSKGQPRVHPAISEARQQQRLVAALLAKVELAPPAPKTGSLNGSQRAELRRLQGGARGTA